MSKAALIVLVLILSDGLSAIAIAQPRRFAGMKVALAPSTFTPDTVAELQPLADKVAQVVDDMIPGEPEEYPRDGIVVFKAPSEWLTKKYLLEGGLAPPITRNGALVGGEAVEAGPDTIRIAVTGSGELPKWRDGAFVFELAHELGHVKMGVRTNNYLDETFAVAISLEVLRRLGYEGYLLSAQGYGLLGPQTSAELPLTIQKALAYGKWEDARTYWRDSVPLQDQSANDRTLQMLGATLILRRFDRLVWSQLFDVSDLNICANSAREHTYTRCSPNIDRMKRQHTFLSPLGLD